MTSVETTSTAREMARIVPSIRTIDGGRFHHADSTILGRDRELRTQ
ncbi:MAG: hypothetical protein AAGE88_17910 [Actinomycetota bacterium]